MYQEQSFGSINSTDSLLHSESDQQGHSMSPKNWEQLLKLSWWRRLYFCNPKRVNWTIKLKNCKNFQFPLSHWFHKILISKKWYIYFWCHCHSLWLISEFSLWIMAWLLVLSKCNRWRKLMMYVVFFKG